jgi:hypothetical protein
MSRKKAPSHKSHLPALKKVIIYQIGLILSNSFLKNSFRLRLTIAHVICKTISQFLKFIHFFLFSITLAKKK